MSQYDLPLELWKIIINDDFENYFAMLAFPQFVRKFVVDKKDVWMKYFKVVTHPEIPRSYHFPTHPTLVKKQFYDDMSGSHSLSLCREEDNILVERMYSKCGMKAVHTTKRKVFYEELDFLPGCIIPELTIETAASLNLRKRHRERWNAPRQPAIIIETTYPDGGSMFSAEWIVDNVRIATAGRERNHPTIEIAKYDSKAVIQERFMKWESNFTLNPQTVHVKYDGDRMIIVIVKFKDSTDFHSENRMLYRKIKSFQTHQSTEMFWQNMLPKSYQRGHISLVSFPLFFIDEEFFVQILNNFLSPTTTSKTQNKSKPLPETNLQNKTKIPSRKQSSKQIQNLFLKTIFKTNPKPPLKQNLFQDKPLPENNLQNNSKASLETKTFFQNKPLPENNLQNKSKASS